MSKKQWCSLAAVTAMLFMTGLAVWKLQQVPDIAGETSNTAILTNSIVLYLAYLFSTLPGRSQANK